MHFWYCKTGPPLSHGFEHYLCPNVRRSIWVPDRPTCTNKVGDSGGTEVGEGLLHCNIRHDQRRRCPQEEPLVCIYSHSQATQSCILHSSKSDLVHRHRNIILSEYYIIALEIPCVFNSRSLLLLEFILIVQHDTLPANLKLHCMESGVTHELRLETVIRS